MNNTTSYSVGDTVVMFPRVQGTVVGFAADGRLLVDDETGTVHTVSASIVSAR